MSFDEIEWNEWKKEYREDCQMTNRKLDNLMVEVAVLKTKMMFIGALAGIGGSLVVSILMKVIIKS